MAEETAQPDPFTEEDREVLREMAIWLGPPTTRRFAESETARRALAHIDRLEAERDDLVEKSTALIEGLAKQFPQVGNLCKQMGWISGPR